MNVRLGSLLLVGWLVAGYCAGAAETVPKPIAVESEYRAHWTSDAAFIGRLAKDSNPQYEANKRLVLEFEAALERAQTVAPGQPGNIDEVVEKYLSADYVQDDPSFPPGRDGFLNFFRMIQKGGERVSHPPVLLVAEGDLVVLMMRRAPIVDPNDRNQTYTAYRIAIWRVRGGQLVEHWGPGLKGKP
jgi:predicted SnoaL-like aldol condensation-catalyzing enzyme